MGMTMRYGFCDSEPGACVSLNQILERAADILRLNEADRAKFVSAEEPPCKTCGPFVPPNNSRK